MKFIKPLFLALSLTLLSACGGGSSSGSSEPTTPLVIVAFGDSLTAGNFFVTPEKRWVNLLRDQITADGIDAKVSVTVVNEGLGGETAADALLRLPQVLATYKPTHIFLAHGTNDIWWACPGCYTQTQANLQKMAEMAQAAGAKVIMADITYRERGEAAATQFTAMYTAVASATKSEYIHLVSGLTFDTGNYNSDQVHLTDAAQETVKNNAARVLYTLF